ncbi:MAG: hypothetical protein ABSF91_00375 [Bacteroidota bacterium]
MGVSSTSIGVTVRLRLLPWLLLLSGCFYFGKDTYDDLVRRSPDTWSTRDCLTIVMAATSNNFYDQNCPNVKVLATVYSPSVIMANYRRAHILGRHHEPLPPSEVPPIESLESIADSEYVSSLDVLVQEEAGLYYDWQTDRYVDARGNYVNSYTQVDSLTVFIAIENKGWPLYIPIIDNLENQIYLVNDQNKFIRPLMVWGRRQTRLVTTENLIAKFRVRKDNYHFLEHSEHMRLLIDGFDGKIRLEFPVSLLR